MYSMNLPPALLSKITSMLFKCYFSYSLTINVNNILSEIYIIVSLKPSAIIIIIVNIKITTILITFLLKYFLVAKFQIFTGITILDRNYHHS